MVHLEVSDLSAGLADSTLLQPFMAHSLGARPWLLLDPLLTLLVWLQSCLCVSAVLVGCGGAGISSLSQVVSSSVGRRMSVICRLPYF